MDSTELKAKANELFKKYGVSLTAEEQVVRQMAEQVLADGTSIFTDSDAWAVGVRAFAKDETGNDVPLADGEYETADGNILTVAGGMVEEIATKAEEAPEEPEMQSEETNNDEQINALLSIVSTLEAKLSTLELQNAELNKQITKLSKQAAVPSVKDVKQSANKSTEPTKHFSQMTYEERFAANLQKFNK
jgi:hypothetical protein